MSAGVQCHCGRFLANAHAMWGTDGEGYSWHMFVEDVRGDCSRCGPDVQAATNGDYAASWWAWDNWTWPPEVEAFA